jgi:dephospho-CoA kinase
MLDAPTLYQSGADEMCRRIIAVVADKTTCVRRITGRDNISEADALLRMSSQPDADFYKKRADFIIENNEGLTGLLKRADEVIKEIKCE